MVVLAQVSTKAQGHKGGMDFSLQEIGVVELLYISLLTFWLIYLYFVKHYGYWEERSVPHVPAVFPFGSMINTLFGKVYWGFAFDEVYRQFKSERYVGYFYVRTPCLLIRDPDLIGNILEKNFEHFVDHGWIDANPKDYMSRHLYHKKGNDWKETRQKLDPAYTAAKMKMMFCLLKKSSDQLREVVQTMTDNDKSIDVKDILTRFSMDVMGNCAASTELNTLTKGKKYCVDLVNSIWELEFKALFKMYIYSAFPIFTKLYCFDLLDVKLMKAVTGALRREMRVRDEGNVHKNDFLGLLIKLKQNQCILEQDEKPHSHKESLRPGRKEGLTVEEIIAETFLFFAAGYETTSSTALFALYELACHWAIQEKLYREVETVLTKHDGNISYQALGEMTYMDQVLNESMRRYPVFSHLVRCCTKDFLIPESSLVVEQGLRLIVPIYSLQHDPQYFPDPYRFDPERFSPAQSRQRHPYTFLPFGKGPRMCIGFRFGMMEVKTVLASLIYDYHLSLPADAQVPLLFKNNSISMLPSTPLKLVFTRRRPQCPSTSTTP